MISILTNLLAGPLSGIYVTSRETLSYAIFWLLASKGPFTPAIMVVSPMRRRINRIIRTLY